MYVFKLLTSHHQFINHPDAFPKSQAKTHLEMSLKHWERTPSHILKILHCEMHLDL